MYMYMYMDMDMEIDMDIKLKWICPSQSKRGSILPVPPWPTHPHTLPPGKSKYYLLSPEGSNLFNPKSSSLARIYHMNRRMPVSEMLCKFTLIDPLFCAIILMHRKRRCRRQADGNGLAIFLFDKKTKVRTFTLLMIFTMDNRRFTNTAYCEQYWYDMQIYTNDSPFIWNNLAR